MEVTAHSCVFTDICDHFDNYDFDKDMVFQQGWSKIKERFCDATELQKQLLGAKLFYYSKHFQPLTLETYLSWKHSQNPVTAEHRNSSPDTSMVDQKQTATASASPIPAPADDCSDVEDSQPQYPTSFVDIMKLVQEGAEIPGLVKLNVQATNLSVSESEMAKPKKPWEK